MSKPEQDETMGWTTVDVRRISRQGRLVEVSQAVVLNASIWDLLEALFLSSPFFRSGTTSLVLKKGADYPGQ